MEDSNTQNEAVPRELADDLLDLIFRNPEMDLSAPYTDQFCFSPEFLPTDQSILDSFPLLSLDTFDDPYASALSGVSLDDLNLRLYASG